MYKFLILALLMVKKSITNDDLQSIAKAEIHPKFLFLNGATHNALFKVIYIMKEYKLNKGLFFYDLLFDF